MEVNGPNQQGAGSLPFTPEGAAIFEKYDPAKYDYTGHCLPLGFDPVYEFSDADSDCPDKQRCGVPI